MIIEREFPLEAVNVISAYEASFKMVPKELKDNLNRLLDTSAKNGYRLKPNNLIYYPARMPPSAARVISLAALAKAGTAEDVLRAAGLEALKELVKRTGRLTTLYMVNPDRELVARLVGSRPEDLTVVDPMAGGGAIPLEAKRLGFTVIAGDYNPVAYLILRATIEFPAKYGRKLYELAKEEAEKLIQYMKERLEAFYDERSYIFFPAVEHACGHVVPLVKYTALNNKKNIYLNWRKEGNEIVFSVGNEPGKPIDKCPFCGRPIDIKEARKRWAQKHVEIIEKLLAGDASAAEEIPKAYKLAAISISSGKYRPAGSEDVKRFVEAARALASLRIENYLPPHPIPPDNDVFRPVIEAGIRQWRHFFTPRQLLYLAHAVKYIRERAQELKTQYGEMGVATALYLTFGLAKSVNFNNIFTQWAANRGAIRDLVGSHYARSREIDLAYDFVDSDQLHKGLPWAFEVDVENYEKTSGGLLPVLKHLAESLEGLWREGRDGIYLWDARELDKYVKDVDLINVDPPYFDYQDYGGISEFFWYVLQQALWPVLDDLFPPERVKIDWSPYSPELPKSKEIGGRPERYGPEFEKFLRAAAKALKRDGLLVIWFAYSKLKGWEELIYRLYRAGYVVAKNWPVWTQMPTRTVALLTNARFTSLIIVARPNAERKPLLNPFESSELARAARERARASLRYASTAKIRENEALMAALVDGMSAVTEFSTLNDITVYRQAVAKAARAILEELGKTHKLEIPELKAILAEAQS